MPAGGQRADQIVEQRPKATRDLHVAGAVGADLGARDADEVLPVRRPVDDARPPVRSAIVSPRSRRRPTRRSRRCSWSSASTPVVGSLIAGDSALSAMSTMMRKANSGSCSIVRSGPNATARLQSMVGDRRRRRHGARTAARPVATKSPTCGTNSTIPSARLRICHQRVEIDREHDARRAAVQNGPPSPVGRRQTPSRLPAPRLPARDRQP